MRNINWKQGQLLLPEHFRLTEESVDEKVISARKFQNLDFYGLADVQFDQSSLEIGVLKFIALKLISSNGKVFVLGQNLKVKECALEDSLADTSAKSLYLHIISQEYNQTTFEQEEIETILYKGVLSPESMLEDSICSMPLFAPSQTPNGKWQLDPHKNLPLLSFKNSHFWQAFSHQLTHIIMHVEQHIKDDLIGHISPAKYVMAQNLLMASVELKSMMAGVEQRGSGAPEPIFQKIYQYYIKYAFYIDEEPELMVFELYRSGECMMELLATLTRISIYQVQEKSLISFVDVNGLFHARSLPVDFIRSMRVYLLVRENDKNEFSIRNLKLAASTRISIVHQNALPGLELAEEKAGKFSHLFDSKSRLFKILPSVEWDYVVKDGQLSLKYYGNLAVNDVYLYSPDVSD